MLLARNIVKLLPVLILALCFAAAPSFAELPRYVEGEAIVMLRSAAPLAAANSLSADGVPAIAKNSAAPDLGAVVVQSFRPVKAAPQDGAEAEAAGGAARMRPRTAFRRMMKKRTPSRICAAPPAKARKIL